MILKFQQGGPVPFVSYTPLVRSQGQPQHYARSQENTGNLADAEIKKALIDKLKGLPNEVNAIIGSLENIQLSGESLESNYLNILSKINLLNFNREEFNNVKQIINDNDGLNEVAITELGQLIVKDQQGEYEVMSPDQFKKVQGYHVVTNAELLRQRYSNPNLAFNNNVFDTIKNGIGIDKAREYIQNIIGKIGETNKDAKVSQGIKLLGSSENLTKDQKQQLNHALYFIYRTLPTNIKTLLKYYSEDGTDLGAAKLIESLALSQEDIGYGEDNSSSKKGSSSGDNKIKLSPVGLLHSGFGEKTHLIIQTPEGKNTGISVIANKSVIKDLDSTNTTLADVFKSEFAGGLDDSNVTMGGIPIDRSSFNKILTSNTIFAGYIPIDIEAYEKDIIKPDFKILKKYSEVCKQLEDQNITDPIEVNNAFRKAELPAYFDGKSTVSSVYKKFIMINADALESAFTKDVTYNNYITEIFDENQGNNIIANLNKANNSSYNWDASGNFWEGDTSSIFRGVLFIPFSKDFITATSTDGEKLTPEQAIAIDSEQQAILREASNNRNYNNRGNNL